MAWVVILAVGWSVAGLLTIILVGFLLFPLMIVLTVVPFRHEPPRQVRKLTEDVCSAFGVT